MPIASVAFAEFYTRFPRHKARVDAEKAWRQVKGDEQAEAIMAGLEAQLPELTEAHRRGFCPYPATWLRGQRWTDEVEAPPEVVPTAREIADYRVWRFAMGPTSDMPLQTWVQRQRARGAA